MANYCFDVDGTLISEATHRAPVSALDSLRALQAQGHAIFVATGRSLHSYQTTNLFPEIRFDGYILDNGQSIYDPDFMLLSQQCLDPQQLREIDAYGHAHKIVIQFNGETTFINAEPDEPAQQSMAFLNVKAPAAIHAYTDEAIRTLMVFNQSAELMQYFEGIPAVRAIPGMAPYCDIVRSDANKAQGIRQLLTLLGHSTDYIAVGDSLNDIEMLRQSQYAIAMGNAHPDLKTIAAFITATPDEDGIKKALQQCLNLEV